MHRLVFFLYLRSRISIKLHSGRVPILLRWVHRGDLFVRSILKLLQNNGIRLLRLWPSPHCFCHHVLGYNIPMPNNNNYRLLGWKKKAREDVPSAQLILDDKSKLQGINWMIQIPLIQYFFLIQMEFATYFLLEDITLNEGEGIGKKNKIHKKRDIPTF